MGRNRSLTCCHGQLVDTPVVLGIASGIDGEKGKSPSDEQRQRRFSGRVI